ncbi:MAG: methyltransferase domain-containing protein [Firmicutes bacterium]|nr:methyltransferase domain-containing protein [Bacillota bacterium]
MSAKWYEELFDETFMRTYAPFLTPERTISETEWIVRTLGLAPPAAILDIPCGFGRHSIELARRGFDVTGLDLSRYMLEVAAVSAREAGVELRLIQKDMMAIRFHEEFDAVLNLFTSIGYAEDDSGDEDFISGVHRALRPGGCFLLDTVNKHWIIKHGSEQHWSGSDGAYNLETSRIDPLRDRLVTERLIIMDGKEHRRRMDLRLYSFVELKKMLERAGLSVTEVWGNLAGAEFKLESPRVVILSHKPERRQAA